MTNTNAAKKLATARAQLVLGNPFFGMLALRLRLTENLAVKTLAVDGKSVFYNPEFVLGLSDSLCRSAMAHEVMHCVLDHMSRRETREAQRWNRAADYALNQILKDAGFEIGEGWLLSSAYRGMSADQIYNMLPTNDSDSDGGGSGDGGDALDELMPGAPGEQAVDAIEWKIATIQAAQIAKKQGKLPGVLDRFIEECNTPKVDWRAQLQRFVTQICKDDYSWGRPNRRYLSAGFYLPGMYSENMGDIVVGIDTSGSIDDKTLQAFGAEIRAIAASVRPSKIHVVYCDAEVNHVDTFGPDEELKFAAHGGGGTAFKPVFDYVEEHALNPECLVYLTDLYGQHDFTPPAYPTLWCCTSDQTASFGDTVQISI